MEVSEEVMDFEAYEEEYDYDQCYDDQSSDQTVQKIIQIGELPAIIRDDVERKQIVCCMDFEQTLMLYSLVSFDSEAFDHLIDAEQTGRKMINFTENFKLTSEDGTCPACAKEAALLQNTCGHAFCFDCWASYLLARHSSPEKQELFPRCARVGCEHFVSYKLMEPCWLYKPLLGRRFTNLMCIKYCEQNRRVKICPNMSCGRVVNVEKVGEATVVCHCGVELCKFCGKESHLPLRCDHLNAWSKISAIADEVEWRSCPICQNLVDKRSGLLVECPQCYYIFCWTCLLPKFMHEDFLMCYTAFDKFQNRIGTAMSVDGRSLSRTKFPEVKHQEQNSDAAITKLRLLDVGQLKQILKEFSIKQNDAEVLSQVQRFLLEAFGMLKLCHVYEYFELEKHELLGGIIGHISRRINRLEKYLCEIIPARFEGSRLAGMDEYEAEATRRNFVREKMVVQAEMVSTRRALRLIKEEEMEKACDVLSDSQPLRI